MRRTQEEAEQEQEQEQEQEEQPQSQHVVATDLATYRGFYKVQVGTAGVLEVCAVAMALLGPQTRWYQSSLAAAVITGLYILARTYAHTMSDWRDGHRFGVVAYLGVLYIHSALAVGISWYTTSSVDVTDVSVFQFYFFNTVVLYAALLCCGLVHGTQVMTPKASLLSGAPFVLKTMFTTCRYQLRPELLRYFSGSVAAQQAIVCTLAAVSAVCFCGGVWLASLFIGFWQREERLRCEVERALARGLSERDKEISKRDELIERLRCEKERVGYELMLANVRSSRKHPMGSTDGTDSELAALDLPVDDEGDARGGSGGGNSRRRSCRSRNQRQASSRTSVRAARSPLRLNVEQSADDNPRAESARRIIRLAQQRRQPLL